MKAQDELAKASQDLDCAFDQAIAELDSDMNMISVQALPQKTRLKDIAILYRTHFQSRAIEESLIKNSIPYIIVGGIRFYERKEVKDIIAYLRVLNNLKDNNS